MGVGLVRSLQPPDIPWIHWKVYNSIANTSKGILFCPLLMPLSEAFSISFYFNKTLLHKSSSSPPEAKNPGVLSFSNNLSIGDNFVCLGREAQTCPTLCDPMDCSSPGFLCPWDSPGKNTGVACHFLLQGIF